MIEQQSNKNSPDSKIVGDIVESKLYYPLTQALKLQA
jgi:hypothetical protein